MNADAGRVRAARPAPAGPGPEAIVVSLGAVLTAAIAVAAAYPEALARPMLLAGLAVVIPLPIVVRALQGKLDLLEPIQLMVLGHLALYLARPIAMLAYDQEGLEGIPFMQSFNEALAISLVGVIAVYGGYALPYARGLARRLPRPPAEIPTSLTLRVAGWTLAMGLLLWGVFLVQSGGPDVFFDYIQGRSQSDKALFRASSGYFYLAPFAAIPAALMLLDANARRASLLALAGGVFAVVFVLVITGPRGDRSFLLLLLLPLISQHFLRKGTRPRLLPTVVTVLLAIIFVNVLINYRRVELREGSFGQTLVRSVTDPGDQLQEFALGPDTTMFPLTAIMIETMDGHVVGSTFTSFIASPIPGNLWPDKPRDPDVIFYQRVFPEAAAVGDAGNALGYFGSYWYDGWYVMLILCAGLTGLGFRVLYEYLQRYPGHVGAQLMFSNLLPFTIVLIRGNPTQVFGVGLFIVFPTVVLLYLASRRERARAT